MYGIHKALIYSLLETSPSELRLNDLTTQVLVVWQWLMRTEQGQLTT